MTDNARAKLIEANQRAAARGRGATPAAVTAAAAAPAAVPAVEQVVDTPLEPAAAASAIETVVFNYLALREQAKALYQRAEGLLDEAIRRLKPGDAVTLFDGRRVALVDNFATSNTAWKAASAHHYELTELKKPKAAKAEQVDG